DIDVRVIRCCWAMPSWTRAPKTSAIGCFTMTMQTAPYSRTPSGSSYQATETEPGREPGSPWTSGGTGMTKPLSRQLELFADGARAVAAAKRTKPPWPTEERLQARLDSARQRLRELVIFGLMT